MKSHFTRNEFNGKTKEIMAKRAGFLCSICRSITAGPSFESIVSTTSIGVAAHITAASPGGPRYDPSITTSVRSSISNGIWLCQNHGAIIDRDCKIWTVSKLKQVKSEHEEFIMKNIGVPNKMHSQLIFLDEHRFQQIVLIEYGFVSVGTLVEPYKRFITPILKDKKLNDNDTLGVLMCGTPPEVVERNRRPSWTVFVNNDWLQWYIKGQTSGFKTAQEISNEQIYGQIPGWPNSFFEFLKAMVKTNTTFEYKRHKNGYLTLLKASKKNSS